MNEEVLKYALEPLDTKIAYFEENKGNPIFAEKLRFLKQLNLLYTTSKYFSGSHKTYVMDSNSNSKAYLEKQLNFTKIIKAKSDGSLNSFMGFLEYILFNSSVKEETCYDIAKLKLSSSEEVQEWEKLLDELKEEPFDKSSYKTKIKPIEGLTKEAFLVALNSFFEEKIPQIFNEKYLYNQIKAEIFKPFTTKNVRYYSDNGIYLTNILKNLHSFYESYVNKTPSINEMSAEALLVELKNLINSLRSLFETTVIEKPTEEELFLRDLEEFVEELSLPLMTRDAFIDEVKTLALMFNPNSKIILGTDYYEDVLSHLNDLNSHITFKESPPHSKINMVILVIEQRKKYNKLKEIQRLAEQSGNFDISSQAKQLISNLTGYSKTTINRLTSKESELEEALYMSSKGGKKIKKTLKKPIKKKLIRKPKN